MITVESIAAILEENSYNDVEVSREDGYPRVEWWDEDDALNCIAFYNSGVIGVMKGKHGETIFQERFTSYEEFERFWKSETE